MSCDHGIFECHDTQLSSVSHISITPVSYRFCHNGFQGCFSCTLLLDLELSTQVIDFVLNSLVYWGRKMWHQYWCQLELLSKLVWTFQYIILVSSSLASHLNTDTFLSGFNGQLIDPSMLFHLFLVNLYC